MARNWTEEEEKIILEETQKNPDNLRDAFFVASLRIKRTPSAICTRYYGKMTNEDAIMTTAQKIKRLEEQFIEMYNLNLELKKELSKWKK